MATLKSAFEKTIFAEREFWLIVGIFLAILLGTLGVFFVLYEKFRILFLWAMIFTIVAANRASDIWLYGIQVIHLLIFLSAYVFGFWFALSFYLPALIIVSRVKPYRLTGAIVHFFAYTGTAIAASYLAKNFGTAITASNLVFYGMLITFVFNTALTYPIVTKITPIDWRQAIVSRILWTIGDYTVLTILGMQILQFFLSVKGV